MGAIISFLGGSAFRMIWGEIASYFTKKQDAKNELARLTLQGTLDAAAHERNLAAMKLQSDLGIKNIEATTSAELSKIDVSAWAEGVAAVGRTTGLKFLDYWNGSIRPFLATMAAAFLITEIVANHGVPTEHVLLVGDAVLGMYVADRSLAKRGK